MNKTQSLIEQLSQDVKPVKPMPKPRILALGLCAVMAIYGLAAQYILGLRPDLAVQFMRPLFVAETVLLVQLLFCSAFAAILSLYPDIYQKSAWLKVPFLLFALLFLLIIVQLFLPIDGRMVVPDESAHKMECALCIAAVALIPAAIIFMMLRYGATIKPLQAGVFAVLAASAVGCLTLRLAEANDSMMHLALWHYLPTLLFASLGAFLGKFLLKW